MSEKNTLMAYVPREIVYCGNFPRVKCGSFGRVDRTSSAGDFNWLFGEGRIGIVLAEARHSRDGRTFYYGIEKMADGSSIGPIFVNVNPAKPSVHCFGGGNLRFQGEERDSAMKLVELLTSPVQLYLFKAWRGEAPEAALDYLVFSRSAPDGATYRYAAEGSIIIDNERAGDRKEFKAL